MSLLDNQTKVNAGTSFYATTGGGGGGSGPNPVFSTITLEGSNAITASLPSAGNDGFEVRNGGAGNNVLVITTIDAGSSGQIEMGARTISTIGGNPVPRGRFEMQMVPASDSANLSYTLDTVGAGNASTIGVISFVPGTAPGAGTVVIKGENANGGGSLTIGNGSVIAAPSGAHLECFKATVANSGNIYMPAAGTTTPIANFSTIAGHQYELWIPNLRVQNEPAGAPAAGAWTQLTIDGTPITYVDIFDMAAVSTIQNDLQKAPAYNFYASGASHTLSANGSLANTLSTAITINPPVVYLRDLGAPANMQLIG